MSITAFKNIIVAECADGQKKAGVDEGGLYICKNLSISSDIVIDKRVFANINATEENGYKIISDILKYFHDFSSDTNRTVLIGGDHSLGISSVDYYLNKYQDKLKVLWIDAHADINDHITSLSGNLHGMPLGYHHISRTNNVCWRENPYKLNSSQLYYLGIRDLDPAETELIQNQNIGFSNSFDNKLKDFIDSSEFLLISFDVDALDPSYVDSTGCLASNGLSPSDVKSVIDYTIQTNKIIHLDIMEFNPLLGNPEKSIEALKTIFL
jgi:arginase